MPGLVMSIDVEPPIRTENSGIRVSRIALIFFRLLKSGSHLFFSSKVEDMVKVAVKGMQTDRFEIRPGQANQLKMMNRLAPGFILKQMSRSVDRMLRTQN